MLICCTVCPGPGPWDKDTHKIEDLDGLALPDATGGRPARRPGYVIVVDKIRGPGQASFVAEVLETHSRPHPTNPNPTWKPNYYPHPGPNHRDHHQ
jgi:hypothetical protein